ncbi:Hypothetical protein ORPV_729, partial [Orpheovirus IHUMI-LCC2]
VYEYKDIMLNDKYKIGNILNELGDEFKNITALEASEFTSASDWLLYIVNNRYLITNEYNLYVDLEVATNCIIPSRAIKSMINTLLLSYN